MKQRVILFKSKPEGTPTKVNFEIVEKDLPQLNANQVLLKTVYLSVDPYMRGILIIFLQYLTTKKGKWLGLHLTQDHSNLMNLCMAMALQKCKNHKALNSKRATSLSAP